MPKLGLRKKKLLYAGVAGACLVFLPFSVVTGVMQAEKRQLTKELDVCQKQLEADNAGSLFVLKEEIQKDQIVTEEDIMSIPVRSKEVSLIDCLQPKEELLGKRAKKNLKAGVILQEDALYTGEVVGDDERIHSFQEIVIPDTLVAGDFMDIRIVFPNGEDYVVASRKKIYSLMKDEISSEANVTFLVSAEEILRLASAKTDKEYYAGTKIYAIKYLGDFQKAAEVNYPVNPKVYRLKNWDPNIITRLDLPQEREKRTRLEENLKKYDDANISSAYIF